jgi:hypothetical protein
MTTNSTTPTADKAQQTIDDIAAGLAAAAAVAPSIASLINTLLTKGSVSLSDLAALQTARQAAVAAADQALAGS